MANRDSDRFAKVYDQKGLMGSSMTEIWVDRETKVCYLWHTSGYAGGLTPLLDVEGKPQLWREPLGD